MSASSQPPFPKVNAVPVPEKDMALLKTTLDAAKQSLFNNGSILPQAVMQSEDDSIFMILGEPFDYEESKDRFALIMKVSTAKHRALRINFMSEVWGFRSESQEEFDAFNAWRAEAPGASFKDYPGKGVVESVFIVFESIDGVGSASVNIHRAADNTPYILDNEVEIGYYTRDQLKTYGKSVMTGRFTDLLAHPKMWDDPRAQEMIKLTEVLLQDHIHDQDSDLVKSIKEDAEKHDSRIPRDLQN